MYTTVLFDLDGTLLDTLGDLAAAGNQTLATLRFPPHPPDAYRQMVGGGVANLVEQMLPPQSRGISTCQLALVLFSRYYEETQHKLTVPYPGIPQLLQELQQAGIALGVVSNKPHQFVGPILEQYFPGVFSAAVGNREGVPTKPDPAAVFSAMADMGCTASGTLFCGDSDVDMLTARAAGLVGCGVLWGFRSREELAAAGAHLLAKNTDELRAHIFEEALGFEDSAVGELQGDMG